MNILNITKSLHERINSATSLDEILILTKTIERLNLGTVKTVSNYSDLLFEYPQEGEVYFVENEEQLYYGFNGLWYLIFRTATTLAYGWGKNQYGENGDNTATSRRSPVTVVGGFTDWTYVAGTEHSVGLQANGTLWAWGRNSYGQLGTNDTSNRSSPLSVVGGFTDWVSVSAARRHTLGLRANGTAWSWGFNSSGGLGDGTTVSKSSPVSVVGGFTDWTSITAGYDFGIGLRSNGTLWAWGANNFGQLGDNTLVSKSSPVSVVGGFTWKTLSISEGAGNNPFIGAIKTDGTLWTWGRNTSGELGDGTTVSKRSPVSVVGGFTDWIALSCGSSHEIGLRSNGTIWAWGLGSTGQLGDNTINNRSSPVSVLGGFTDWILAKAGSAHSLGVRANGTLWAWGWNNYGQLGDNTITSRRTPVVVVGGFTDWISASATASSSLGIRSTT